MADLSIIMITQQTKYVIQHLRNRDSVGRRIEILMCHHQLESGLSTQFERGSVKMTAAYIKGSIILNLLVELEKLGAKLLMKHCVPPGRRETIIQALMQRWAQA